MTREKILAALTEPDASALFAEADRVRHESVGDAVHLRGLVEFSNICTRRCTYCGMRAPNATLPRYRMTREEILACARLAAELKFGTLVLQSGEDPTLEAQWVADLIRAVKNETPLAVTLSLGEHPQAHYALWRAAGADRYLLRFETSDLQLFHRIHPGSPQGKEHPRIAHLHTLRAQGYEIGSGVMTGIPGQSLHALADDLLLFKALDLDMVGIGPYIPDPGTPLAQAAPLAENQAPPTAQTALRAIALTRLLLPRANIPSTTALSTLDPARGRRLGLTCGANILMPNLTPKHYRDRYTIYPGKICIKAPEADDLAALYRLFEDLRRHPGAGPGGRTPA